MLFTCSQQQIELVVPPSIKKIGIKISGGADSALVCYMFSLLKRFEHPEIELIPITCIASSKPYQEIFSKRILSAICDRIGIDFGPHYLTTAVTGTREVGTPDYIVKQTQLVDDLFERTIIEGLASGITANPPSGAVSEYGGPIDDRTKIPGQLKPVFNVRSWVPLINIDKSGVSEFYSDLDLMAWLFPLTRSCEKHTHDFSHHCGECWFCKERLWGFSRLI